MMLKACKYIFPVVLIFAICLSISISSHAQPERHKDSPNPLAGPENNDLWLYESKDGKTFTSGKTIVERAGVPCVIRDTKGRLVLVFQWFPLHRPDADDRIAVAFSDDDGKTWTDPEPIKVHGLPESYKRPFDPTLVVLEDGSFRLYFTSHQPPERRPAIYSAVSRDAIYYEFEAGVRSVGTDFAVIDCCAIRWQGIWHLYANYLSREAKPVAYHAVSGDGVNFRKAEEIRVPHGAHWLGNLIETDDEIRFFGSGMGGIWSAYSHDGYTWTQDMQVRADGGDPTVFRTRRGHYGMIVVGPRHKDTSEPSFQRRRGSEPDHSSEYQSRSEGTASLFRS